MEKVDPRQIRPADYNYRALTPEEILYWFDLCDAAWVHDGDPSKPHAELTSGLCSNGYFDCPRVLQHPNLNEILANQLVRKLSEVSLGKLGRVDWVVGSAYAAITFSYEVARILGAIHGFVEKDPADPAGKRMFWRRVTIPAGSKVLQVEELITTSGTFREVRRAIEEGNGEPVEFLPLVGCLVHRPPKLPADYGDRQVIALIEKEVWAVKPEDCSLCKAGSIRYRPKSHWAELTGKK
jgi:orotate phosphoribosyltransferase